MPLQVTCDKCGKKYRIADEMAGKTLRCKDCNATFVAKAATTAITTAAPKSAARPTPPRMPPPAPRADIEDDERPRRRPRSVEEDDLPVETRRRRRVPEYDDEDDDEYESRPRRKKKSRSKSRPKLPSALVMFLAFAGFWAVTLALALLIGKVGLVLMTIVGGFLHLAGLVLILVAAFEDDIVTGIFVLLIPFYSLYFVWAHYDKTWRGFHIFFYGVLLWGTSKFVAEFTPREPPAGAPRIVEQPVPQRPNPRIVDANPVQPPPQGNAPPAPVIPGKPPALKPPVPKLTGDETLDALLAQLRTPIGFKAANQLAKMPVNPVHQAVVVGELAALVKENDRVAGNAAVEALAAWATPNEVPILIELIESGDVFKKAIAIKAVGKLRDERAIKPLVQCMLELPTRHNAQEALKQIGSAAEPEVIPLLKNGDNFVVLSAIQLLESIGTAQSLPHLQAVAASTNPWRALAGIAAKKIQARAK